MYGRELNAIELPFFATINFDINAKYVAPFTTIRCGVNTSEFVLDIVDQVSFMPHLGDLNFGIIPLQYRA